MSDKVTQVFDWLEERRQTSGLHVRPVELHACREWSRIDGELRHSTGRYFQIVGTRVSTGDYAGWCRPMIRQHEIGILGFLVAERNGDVEWLLQAKTEPGNVGGTQLAPTVQATESNQQRVHGGAPTRYLKWFTETSRPEHTRSNLLGSEQGTRFLGKRNRNTTVIADPMSVPIEDDAWRWLDRATLRELLGRDFIVNTDARSVIATCPWSLIAEGSRPFAARSSAGGFERRLADSYDATANPDSVMRELAVRRVGAIPLVREVPMAWAAGWRIDDSPDLVDDQLTLVEVHVRDREVDHWCQPLLASRQAETCDLYAQVRDGVMRFLFRYRAEPGLRNMVELGPTVQTDQGAEESPPLGLEGGVTKLSVLQSDEGSRFHDCVVRYRIIEIELGPTTTPVGGVWLSLSDIESLASRSGVFTNEARSAISLLLSLA